MKKLTKDQFQTLMSLKLGLENHWDDIKDVAIDSSDKKFNKSVGKIRDRVMGNIKSYNAYIEKLREDYEIPRYIYIDLGEETETKEILQVSSMGGSFIAK